MQRTFGRAAVVFALATVSSSLARDTTAQGDGIVDLLWSTPSGDVVVNDTFNVSLVARSGSGSAEPFSALQAIMNWDPTDIELLGIDNSMDGYGWLDSAFPENDADNLNEGTVFIQGTPPNNDGDAIYQALGQFPSMENPDPFPRATTTGLLVTSFTFRALQAGSTQISSPLIQGNFSETAVLDDAIAGLNILGTTSPGTINIVPEPTTAAFLLVMSSGLLIRRRRGVGNLRRSRLSPATPLGGRS